MLKRGNNDIDFFVPRFPSMLNKFYGRDDHEFIRYLTGTDGQGPEFFYLLKHRILPWFNQAYSEGRMGPLKKITKCNMEENQNVSYYGSITGIQEIIELEFEQNGPKLQIIVIERLPETMVDWDTFVVSTFDIDIVNVAVRVPDQSFHPQVGFTSERARHSFLSGSFFFTVRPGEEFSRGVNRIMKYRKRGFKLQGIEFDSRVIPYFKRYWMDRLRRLFVEELATDLLTKTIKQNEGVLPVEDIAEQQQTLELLKGVMQSVGNEIGAYVWKPPPKEEYSLKLRIQTDVEFYRRAEI
jgi:hypothetical protein